MAELGTIPLVFKDTVNKNPQRMAMRKKKLGLWSKISWQDYYTQVQHVTNALVSMGFQRGDAAAIIGDNCHEWVFIDVGIQSAGGMSVGIYATNAWPQVEYVVKNSDSRFLFVENEEQLDKWLMFRDNAPLLEKVIVWDLKGLRDFKDPMVISFEEFLEIGRTVTSDQPDLFDKTAAAVEPEDVCMIIYTSGTTGDPKGVMLTHRNVIWAVKAVTSVNPINEQDEILSYLPLCHVFERNYSVVGSLVLGYTVNFVERPDTVTENMTEISPTVAYGVPRIWEKYYSSIEIQMSKATWFKRMMYYWAVKIGRKRASTIDKGEHVSAVLRLSYLLAYFAIFRKLKERIGFDRTRQCSSGGAPISAELLFFFQSMGINLTEGYGLTESSAAATSSRVGAWKYGTVGEVLPGVELKITDDGEIILKSPGIFKGYYKNPEGTARALKDGWLYTGDIGELDEDGYLRITDRKKDIVVTAGGKNIAPQYIENKLKVSPYINDAVIMGDRQKYLVCLIMIDEDNVSQYALENKIQYSTYRDLTQTKEVNKLIQEEVNKVNETLSNVEKVKKFRILPKMLSFEDGEVTATMKVKRSFVSEAFSDLIREMYGSK